MPLMNCVPHHAHSLTNRDDGYADRALPADTKAKFDKRAQAINRDLSGLNDLVEVFWQVSRLDAGHALQQVESLDLYHLVNQERQHYPEATLIGEKRIVIDGQSSMLTHLIRNLLTNAMLHGKPQWLYCCMGFRLLISRYRSDYLLQTVLCRSFADYNNSDFASYDEQRISTKMKLNTY